MDNYDKVTAYFVTEKSEHVKGNEQIIAYTTDKKQLKFFLEFLNNPKLKVRKMTLDAVNMLKFTEERCNEDRIIATNLMTKDPERGMHAHRWVVCPVTDAMMHAVSDIRDNLGEPMVNYFEISKWYGLLKDKYKKVLRTIGLEELMRIKVSYQNATSEFVNELKFDEIAILVKTYPLLFGEFH